MPLGKLRYYILHQEQLKICATSPLRRDTFTWQTSPLPLYKLSSTQGAASHHIEVHKACAGLER